MKSKHLKHLISIFILTLILVTSCKNNENVLDTNSSATKSASAKKSMEVFKTHFNPNGTLNDAINPIGNILIDFCYEFVYPVTLSYNNDTEVTVENFNNLVDVVVNSSNDLYIDGIVFPFDIKKIEQNNLVIVTVNNEDEFNAIVQECAFGSDDGCVCSEEYVPVCIRIQDQRGGSFTIEFPNMCYAVCEGYTQSDIVDCDNSNPNGNFFDNLSDCFQLVYPFTIKDDAQAEIVIHNVDEFNTAIYATTRYEFVYPIEVTQQQPSGGTETITISSDDALSSLIATCNASPTCDCPTGGDPVCVATPNGQVIEYENSCRALCDGYTPNNYVTCN